MQSLILSIVFIFCLAIIAYYFIKAQKHKISGNVKGAKRYFKLTIILFILSAIILAIVFSIIGAIYQRR
jgi:hypothetical protein